jgi:hypothetical protein
MKKLRILRLVGERGVSVGFTGLAYNFLIEQASFICYSIRYVFLQAAFRLYKT